MIQLLFSGLIVALLVFSLVSVIMSEDWQVKHLPKIAWILLIVFLPLIGSILWLAVGRERGTVSEQGTFGDPRRRETIARRVVPEPPLEDDDTIIEREIAFHENQARIRRLEADLKAKREQRPQE
jgi:hypothetical protein